MKAVLLVREQRQQRKQELAFNARPFVLCGLPLRRAEQSQLAYTRRNGRFSLTIVAHPEFGLPTVSADCTYALLAFWMGRNLLPLPPAAGSAI